MLGDVLPRFHCYCDGTGFGILVLVLQLYRRERNDQHDQNEREGDDALGLQIQNLTAMNAMRTTITATIHQFCWIQLFPSSESGVGSG